MKRPQPGQSIGLEQATSDRRLWARLIDLFLMAVLFGLLAALVSLALTGSQEKETGRGWTPGLVAAAILAPIFYEAVPLRLSGKTPGKKLLGMRVTNAQGERLGWGWCLLRTAAVYVSLLVGIGLTVATATAVGWIIVMDLPKCNRFPHDAIARSYVLREVKGELQRIAEPAPAPGAPAGTLFADLERLRADGIISEEEYLRKRKELGF